MNSELATVAYSFLFGERRTLFWTTVVCLSVLYRLQKRRRSTKGGSANFDAFLRQNVSTKSTTQFESFLRNTATAELNGKIEHTKEEETRPENAICIPIFYGTEYGFAKEIAESIGTDLKTTGNYWPVLLNMGDFPEGLDLASESVLLMICSTQGDGMPPYEAREFCEWMFQGQIGELSSTAFSICALGDKSYSHFCRCGLKLKSSLISNGAREFAESVKVDREDWKMINKWKSDIVSSLPSLDLTIKSTADFSSLHLPMDRSKVDDWTKTRPFPAKLHDRWDLCNVNEDSDKRTMHLEVDIANSGLTYLPGDAVGVYPKNCPVEVDALLKVLDENPETMIPTPTWTGSLRDASESITLRDALINFFDLKTPRHSMFEMLSAYLEESTDGVLDRSHVHDSGGSIHQMDNSSKQKEAKLNQLMESKELREQYLEDRHIIDVLQDFRSRQLEIKEVLECMRPLQARLYSISSSMLENNKRLSITVAEVKYVTHGLDRKGVTSTWMSERLKIGDELLVYISPNPGFRLPKDLKTPMVMIGPGTGLAPFMAFLQERIHLAEGRVTGTNLLFFGCRRQEQDFLYRSQLESWEQNGVLKLFTAFSREQEKKIYVQDRLWEAKEEVWQLIEQGGQVYVCGDAKYMAPDVEDCLIEILKTEGGLSPSEAQNSFLRMHETGQYQRDVWF